MAIEYTKTGRHCVYSRMREEDGKSEKSEIWLSRFWNRLLLFSVGFLSLQSANFKEAVNFSDINIFVLRPPRKFQPGACVLQCAILFPIWIMYNPRKSTLKSTEEFTQTKTHTRVPPFIHIKYWTTSAFFALLFPHHLKWIAPHNYTISIYFH